MEIFYFSFPWQLNLIKIPDDTTGTHSIYNDKFDPNLSLMFHVSTLLPFTPNNRQQLMRKRHIGNDMVTIVFQEPGSRAFTPKSVRSQFQHVFVVVRLVDFEGGGGGQPVYRWVGFLWRFFFDFHGNKIFISLTTL